MPKTCKREAAQRRALLEAIEDTCLVCGADLVSAPNESGGTMPACPGGPHTKAENDAAFARRAEIAALCENEELPTADEPTAILPTNPTARADVYRQRFDAERAIFHPGDMNECDTLARVVGHTDTGTFFRGDLVAEIGEDEDDDAISIQAFDRADEIRIQWLAGQGIHMQSELYQAVARRAGCDQGPTRSLSDADTGGLAARAG